jgi:hypothetical protein
MDARAQGRSEGAATAIVGRCTEPFESMEPCAQCAMENCFSS